MKPEVSALTVCGRKDHLLDVRIVLKALSISTMQARNCREAAVLLRGGTAPQVVFTDTVLSDGNWMDVMGLVPKAGQKVPVVVVSSHPDMSLYSQAMEKGAYDFLTETSRIPDIVGVLQSVLTSDAMSDRETDA
jgi:DNA-binding NtrC family response regulator